MRKIIGNFKPQQLGWRTSAPQFWLVTLGWLVASMPATAFVPENPEETLLEREYPIVHHTYQSIELAVEQAQSYLTFARQQFDPAYYEYAKSALRPWWNTASTDEFRLLRATINQHDHLFSEALDDLDSILKSQPQHVQARLLRFSVHMAMGNLASAQSDCRKLTLLTDPTLVMICLAQVNGLRGKADIMEGKLLDLLPGSKLDVEKLQELLVTLGELNLIKGNLKRAELYARQTLQLNPRNRYAMDILLQALIGLQDFKSLLTFTGDRPELEMRILNAFAQMQLFQFVNERVRSDLVLEINQLQRSMSKHSAKAPALYYLYIERDPVNALLYALDNWNQQKTVGDATLLLQADRLSVPSQATSKVRQWILDNNIQHTGLDLILATHGG